MHRTAAILLALTLAPATSAAPASAATRSLQAAGAKDGNGLRGLRLEEALERIRASGVELVFSSALVRPEMRVVAEPTADHPRRRLDQLLAPHGLRAIEGDGEALVVVSRRSRAPEAAGAGGSIRGRLLSVFDGSPIAGALVRVVDEDGGDEPPPALTGASGRFALGGLDPGRYTLRVHHPGFAPLPEREVDVTLRSAVDLRLELQPEPYLHEEILVAASRSTVLRSAPAGPLSLSRDEVQALPHLGGDVFRALSLLPGTAANDNTAQLSVHGGRRDELLILLDGQELYQAFHLRDFDDGTSVVTADTLAGVELSIGVHDAGRGDRMGGVLDLTTESPTSLAARLRLSVLNAQLAAGGGLGDDRGSWLASARRGSIDLASRIFGREDPSFWDTFGKIESSFGRRHSLRLRALVADDALDFGETIGREVKRFDTDYDGTYAWLTHDAFLGARTLAETTVSWSGFDRDRRGFEAEEEQTWEVLDERSTTVRAIESRWSFEATPGTTTSWGAAFRRFDTDYDYASSAEPPLLPSSPFFQPREDLRRFVGIARDEHTAAWLSQRWSPVSALTLEVGGRYDRHTLTDDELFSPRLSIAWRTGETSVLRAGWGHHFQSQRSYELGVADGETGFAGAERAEHALLGYERRLSDDPHATLQALRIEAYSRWIDDPRDRFENLYEPINTFPEIEPDRVLVRSDEARARGLELTLRGALGERSTWWLAYSLSRAEDRIAGRWIPRPLDQTHALTLAFGRRLGRGWQLDAAWRFHTGWPTTPIRAIPGSPQPEDSEEPESDAPEEEGDGDEGEEPDGGEPILLVGRPSSDRLSDYHRLDLRLSRSWNLGTRTLRFFVDVQNVYDRENIAGFDLDFDDETGTLNKVAERWSGIFPSVGIVLEF